MVFFLRLLEYGFLLPWRLHLPTLVLLFQHLFRYVEYHDGQNQHRRKVHLLLYKVARTTGLEPVTSADHHGALNQLSYVLKLNLAGATELESVQIVLETIMLIQLHHAPI